MWIRLDDQWANHPKVVSVSRAARCALLAYYCYASEKLTDGFIPSRLAIQKAFEEPGDDPVAVVQELVEARLLEATEGGYRIHDYLDYNPSREDVESGEFARSEQRRKAGQRRAQNGTRGQGGRFTPTSEATSERTSGTSDPLVSLEPAEPAPVPRSPSPVPRSPEAGSNSSGGTPTRGDVDNSAGTGSLRASAPGKPKPKTPSLGPPPTVTDEQAERIDELRRRLQTRDRSAAGRFDRLVMGYLGRGGPPEVLIGALESAIEHRANDPEAYVAKVLRVEEPNHHEAAAIERGKGFTQAMQGLGLRSLQEAAERAAKAQGGPQPP